jgi:hypothetical protein
LDLVAMRTRVENVQIKRTKVSSIGI